MRKSNLWKSASVLFMAGWICCTMPSCSDDNGPAAIESAQPSTAAYMLNEAGEAALEFEVVPENARIDEVKIVERNEAFEAKDFTYKGNGKWLLNIKVSDFTQIRQENTITLSIGQTGGASSEISFVVTDPYSIEHMFTLNHPKGFNYCSADKENLYATGLPVVIAAQNQEDFALIDSKNIKVLDGAVSHKVGAAYFKMIQMTEETGFMLKVDPEKLAELQKAIPTYTTIDLNVQLTAKNNRIANLPLTAIVCAPQAIVENDALTLSQADLMNPDFEKDFDIDVTHKLRHMGILEKNIFEAEECGLLDEKGAPVDSAPFIVTMFNTDTEGNTTCSVNLTGDIQYNYAPGTYYYVQRCSQPWKYNGVTYNPACADLMLKVVIK